MDESELVVRPNKDGVVVIKRVDRPPPIQEDLVVVNKDYYYVQQRAGLFMLGAFALCVALLLAVLATCNGSQDDALQLIRDDDELESLLILRSNRIRQEELSKWSWASKNKSEEEIFERLGCRGVCYRDRARQEEGMVRVDHSAWIRNTDVSVMCRFGSQTNHEPGCHKWRDLHPLDGACCLPHIQFCANDSSGFMAEFVSAPALVHPETYARNEHLWNGQLYDFPVGHQELADMAHFSLLHPDPDVRVHYAELLDRFRVYMARVQKLAPTNCAPIEPRHSFVSVV